jgi:hypothetical protein
MAQDDQDEALTPPPLVRMQQLPDGLTETDLAEIRRLQKAKMKAGQGHCEMCGVNNWNLGDHLWTPLMCKFTATGIGADLRMIYPMVVMVCANCGNTKFLHAKQLGFAKENATDDVRGD